MAQEISIPSSAALAFLGDSVYEVNIRSRMVHSCEGNADELNKRSKALTNAVAQAHMADFLKSEMSEEEFAVYRRGRNMKTVSAPRSCSISEYRRATGLEVLMGYLFLLGRQERLDELLNIGIRKLDLWTHGQDAGEPDGR